MLTAKEKQATRSGICFSCGNNEQTSDEIGQGARQRGFASGLRHTSAADIAKSAPAVWRVEKK